MFDILNRYVVHNMLNIAFSFVGKLLFCNTSNVYIVQVVYLIRYLMVFVAPKHIAELINSIKMHSCHYRNNQLCRYQVITTLINFIMMLSCHNRVNKLCRTKVINDLINYIKMPPCH